MVKQGGPTAYAGRSQDTSPQALHALAVEAAVWGMPIVSVDAMRQAFLRDAGARYGDVVFWSKPADAKLQLTTPNASSRYVVICLDVRAPTVVELPAAIGAGLFGSINDAWQVPVLDVGPEGEDRGKGGKYLLLSPGAHDAIPPGYIPVALETHNVYLALRAIPEDASNEAVERALDLVRAIRIYPLARASSPAPPRFIDMSGKIYDGIVRMDATFFTSLARMVSEEPAFSRDRAMIERIEAIGIRRGIPYSPNAGIREILDRAARDARVQLIRTMMKGGGAFWPEKTWSITSAVGPRTGFTYVENGVLDVNARGAMFFFACALPKRLGKASAYLANYLDAARQPLSGNATYHLHVPPDVPARQFWAVTVYDAETCGFVRDAARIELNSYDRTMQRNPDGSVDVYFAPEPVPGKEANTIATPRGRTWFTLFRFYGPGPALTNKSWQLPDLEPLR